ncbi:hypothetical protein [Streptomyces sp. NPDC092952]
MNDILALQDMTPRNGMSEGYEAGACSSALSAISAHWMCLTHEI